jgi:hypothetical protein
MENFGNANETIKIGEVIRQCGTPNPLVANQELRPQ